MTSTEWTTRCAEALRRDWPAFAGLDAEADFLELAQQCAEDPALAELDPADAAARFLAEGRE